MNTWVSVALVALVGVILYFVFQDWFNQYLVAAKPKFLQPPTKAGTGK